MASIAEALSIALDHHQAGRKAEAEELYRRILDADPRQADALYLWGMLAAQSGRFAEAAERIAQAAAITPAVPDYHLRLAMVLEQLGRLEEAAASYRAALDLRPDLADAAFNMGVMLQRLGRDEEAEAAYARAQSIDPDHAAVGNRAVVLHGLGLRARAAGDLDHAARRFAEAAALRPAMVAAWEELAAVQHALGRTTEAADALAGALRAAPDRADLRCALGTCRLAAGDTAAARHAYATALLFDPADGEAAYSLGVVAAKLGDAAAAEVAYRRSARLRPSDPRPAGNLAVLLDTLAGREGEAAAAFAEAARRDPLSEAAWLGLAMRLHHLGRLDEAAAALRALLALCPGHAEAYALLGSALRSLTEAGAGTAANRRAVRLDPANPVAYRGLMAAVLYDPALDEAARFAEHRMLESLVARPLYARARPHANRPDPDRRLRVGYLSSDLRDHPVARNLEPILAGHDRSRVETLCYADLEGEDAMTAHLRGLVDGWREIAGLSDEAVADGIRADGIDVLVSLAGRFDRNRPLVCALRPAPVQVSLYDGATSGLDGMDALITDRVMTPRGGEERFTERPIRLPTLFAYQPIDDAPDTGPPPVLTTGTVTFGSFNNPAKLNEAVLALWARVLAAVPGSRLVLKYKGHFASPELQRRVRAALERHGVSGDRAVMPAAAQDRQQHLALYRGIDIGLDPFPFCGATTSFEALWMGVPVVTLPGGNMMGRWSASLLVSLGLPELIAATPDDYVRIVAALAADRQGLADLHAGLRRRIQASPILDARRKARHVERAYRALWRRWCAGAAARA